jgi:membrane-associated phospholipid phosphatase
MNEPTQVSKIEKAVAVEEKHSNQAKLDDFVKENRGYMGSFLLLWSIACYLLFAVVEKGEIILFFADNRTESRNHFFTFCTYIGEGYVYVIATVFLLFISYSKSLFISVNAVVVLGVSGILKRYFEHERPCRYFNDLLEHSDLPNYVPDIVLLDGWTTSFPSGHTTSAFAFYTLLAFFIPNKLLKFCCLVLAALVGLSRMYLVQHFLKDVTSGMLTGFLIALFVYWLHDRFAHKWPGKLEFRNEN